MPHITGHDRSQTLLLPESLDDYVGPDNPVRFIDAFVDGLDLAVAGFADVEPKETGRLPPTARDRGGAIRNAESSVRIARSMTVNR